MTELKRLKKNSKATKEKKDWKGINLIAKQLNHKYSLIAEYEDAVDIARENLGEKEILSLEATLLFPENEEDRVKAVEAAEKANEEVKKAEWILNKKIDLLKKVNELLRIAEKRAIRAFPETFKFL